MKKFIIEDRRGYKSPVFGAGAFVLWEVVNPVIPMKLFRGLFTTRGKAETERRRLQSARPEGDQEQPE